MARRAWGDVRPTAPKVYSFVGKSAAEVGSQAATAAMQPQKEALAFRARVLGPLPNGSCNPGRV